MSWPDSLQSRLALSLGLALTVLWLAATTWTVIDLRHEMDEVFDSALQETAQRLLPLAVTEIVNRDPAGGVQRLAPISEHEEYFTYLVRDADGVILMQSHAADAAMFPAWDGPGFRHSATHRFYNEATLQDSIRLTVAEPLAKRQDVAREIVLRLGLPLLLVLPVTLLAVVGLVRLGLAGLQRFRVGIAGRGARDLSAVPVEGLASELRPIADTVNDLLARLSAAFEAERGFASNAAHELRTPLAGAIAQAQRLRHETADPAAAERARVIEATLKRLVRTAERLMQLARAEGGRLRSDALIDLRPVLRMVRDEIGRTGAADRLRLDLPDTPVLSDLDPDALAILSHNLMDNALRHGTVEGPIEISLDPSGRLAVANDGPPVPPEQLPRLTDRFARAGQAEGSGLGLAIVAAIARRTGGTLQLQSPRSGSDRGFEAIVWLPVAARP
ncbi:MAG: ATP-binding protein [Gammaproteobacteria bacterium]|nr:ATP-binding protein [Gammaproteobacteria bacterium]